MCSVHRVANINSTTAIVRPSSHRRRKLIPPSPSPSPASTTTSRPSFEFRSRPRSCRQWQLRRLSPSTTFDYTRRHTDRQHHIPSSSTYLHQCLHHQLPLPRWLHWSRGLPRRRPSSEKPLPSSPWCSRFHATAHELLKPQRLRLLPPARSKADSYSGSTLDPTGSLSTQPDPTRFVKELGFKLQTRAIVDSTCVNNNKFRHKQTH